jgi:transposase
MIAAGDGPGLLSLLARLRTKAEQMAGVPIEIVVIQEAGLDGFWVHRLLEASRIESHVVDAASIAVPRRRRRAHANRRFSQALWFACNDLRSAPVRSFSILEYSLAICDETCCKRLAISETSSASTRRARVKSTASL